MKPNLFLYKNFSAEDHFTNSLCYILNLFPREMGDRFLNRMAVLSGKKADHFGKFENAEFTGFDLQTQESTSKPDMLITTNKTKIYFENKLEAPLGNKQLERHSKDAIAITGKLAFISNNTRKVSDEMLKSGVYLKPESAAHFYWVDFAPVFDFKFRKNSVESDLLEDFRKAMRLNGIQGRVLAGGNDNLYTNGSASHVLALGQLKDILTDIGFKVIRKSSEFTLRVYPKDLYPNLLLNPRFLPTGERAFSEQGSHECIRIDCWTNVGDKEAERRVEKLQILEKSAPETIVLFSTKKYADAGKIFQVIIYIPLFFTKNGRVWDIDWLKARFIFESLKKLLEK